MSVISTAQSHSTLTSLQARQLATFTMVHGICLYLISYVLVYLLSAFGSVILAAVAQKSPVLFHNKILFVNATGWNLYDAIAIYGSPIVIMGIFSLLMFNTFKRSSDKYNLQKPFVFWLLLHAFNRFAGCVIPGMVANESFKYMADWLYIGPYGLFVFAVASLSATVLMGGYFTKLALKSAIYAQSIKSSYRVKYLNQAVLYPWLIGTLLILSIQLPNWRNSLHEISMTVLMVLLILPMYFYLKFLHKKPVSQKKPLFVTGTFNVKLIIYAAVLFIGFRWLLGNGLYF